MQLAAARLGVDALLHARDVVVVEQPPALEIGVGAPLAAGPPPLGRDDVACDPEEPGLRYAAGRSIGRRGVDGREEDLGREIGGESRIVDTPRGESLHRLDVIAVERFERGGIVGDPRELVGSHIRSWSEHRKALPAGDGKGPA